MRSRRTLLAAPCLALAFPKWLSAQRPNKVRRIGYLSLQRATERQDQFFVEILQSVGLEVGKNVDVEWRWADLDQARLPALATDLVASKVDLLVGFSNGEILALKNATTKIPIVMLWAVAPDEDGLVASLRRPGGNVTGTTYFEPSMLTKSFQLLMNVMPSARRIAVLWDSSPRFQAYRIGMRRVDALAASMGIQLQYFAVTRPEEVASALTDVVGSRPDGLMYLQDVVFYYKAADIAAMALERKMPSVGTVHFYVDRGGLLAYYPDPREIGLRTAAYIDRIFRGANPADLPVEQPTRYRLAINMTTANALGLEVPRSLLLQADRAIR